MIRLEGVTRKYGGRAAVDNVSFTVEGRGVVGFLGPNGAGKTTTMRMITGYLMPTEGDVWIAGHNMAMDSLPARRRIGYLPEVVPLYGEMTTRGFLEFAGRVRGLDRKKASLRAEEVAEECTLTDVLDAFVGRLSKGYRQRVGLAQAIVHDPDLLVLDEPTAGIDPVQVVQTRKLISQLGEGRTILFSTHILSEVSSICREVLIINKGRLIAQDRIEKLASLLSEGKRIKLLVQGPPDEVGSRLATIEGVRHVTYRAPHHILDCAAGAEPHAAITRIVANAGWALVGIEAADMGLEEVFMRFVDQADGKP